MNAILLNNRRKSGLPSGFQEVEWLRSSGTQYIDTGYTPSNKTRVVIRLAWNAIANAWAGGFGAGESYNSRVFESYVYSSYVNYNYYNATYGADGSKGYYPAQVNKIYNIDANRNVYTIFDENGNLLKTITATDGEFTAPYTMVLFGIHRASVSCAKMTIYGHVYIYDDDVLVRELVPCWRKTDHVIGMYDLKTKQFLTNSGTWVFTAGPNVKPILPSEYQELKYVSFASGAYIDTGVSVSTDNICTEIKIAELSYLNDKHYLGVTVPSGSGYKGGDVYHITSFNNKYYWSDTSGEKNAGSWSSVEKVIRVYDADDNYSVKVNGTTLGSGLSHPKDNATIDIGRRSNVANFVGDVYYCRMWDNTEGSMVRDMVPCRRKSDSVCGLYDRLTKQFYTNAGAGSITAGPKVYDTVLPAEYRRVAYIEATGTQYLNTGYQLLNRSAWGMYLDFAQSTSSGTAAVWSVTSLATTNEGWATGTELVYRYSGSRQSLGSFTPNQRMNTYALYQNGAYMVYKNGSPVVDVNVSQTTEAKELLLWKREIYGKAKMYGAKLYAYWDPVKEYVPCVRISDSVAGVYDVLNDEFLTNAGTGTFVVGPTVLDNKTYIYKDGVFTYPMTKSVQSAAQSIEYGSNRIQFSYSGTSNTGFSFGTTDKIDLTDYNVAVVVVNFTASGSSAYPFRFGVKDNTAIDYNNYNVGFNVQTNLYGYYSGEVYLDISSVSGEARVVLDGIYTSGVVSEIYLM